MKYVLKRNIDPLEAGLDDILQLKDDEFRTRLRLGTIDPSLIVPKAVIKYIRGTWSRKKAVKELQKGKKHP